MSAVKKAVATGAAVLLALLLIALAALWWLNVRDEGPAPEADAAWTPTAAQIERGAYLARAGDCAACHTPRGGALYAGGLRLETPFGALLSTNITPDPEHGIGRWSPGDFWRALH